MILVCGENDSGRRLDRVLRKTLRDQPLSLIHRLLRQKKVLLDGSPASASDRVKTGSKITVAIPGAALPAAQPPLPEKAGALPLVWEGAGLLVLNKAPGMAVHGPGSLDSLVQSRLAGTLPRSLSFRGGPLHRLDKPTSGLVVFSANIQGARFFSSLLRRRRVKKQYLALLEGRLEQNEVWEDDLVRDKEARKTFAAKNGAEKAVLEGGKPKAALTRVRPLGFSAAPGPAYTLVIAEIESGRTHQIRAQAAARGHPLAGDMKYGGQPIGGQKRRGGGFFLHAWKITLCEKPETMPDSFTAPVPEEFKQQAAALFGEKILLYLFPPSAYNKDNVP
jgi:23S rRNA pseudouridine955/2504/2580 synthase